MRSAVVSLTLLFPAAAFAAEMQPVPSAQAHCPVPDAYCYEWKLVRDDSVRVIAQGYQEGGEVAIYRRESSGRYVRQLSVHAVIEDPKYPGKLFWGYAWDIEDIVLSESRTSIELFVAFGVTDDEEFGAWEIPEGHRAVPFVLFKGSTKRPTEAVKPRTFQRMTIDRAKAQAMANSAKERGSRP